MKKILLLDNNLVYFLNNINYAYGGATIQSSNWLYGFDKLGYEVIVCSNVKIANKSKFKVEFLSYKGVINKLTYIFLLFKLFIKYKPILVYISTPYWNNIYFGIVSLFFKTKIIQRISNNDLASARIVKRFGLLKYLTFKIFLNLSDIILCQNNYQSDYYKRNYSNFKVKKVFNPYRVKYSNLSNFKGQYVAWMGIFQHQKNMKKLYEICQRLTTIQFKIAGESLPTIDDESKLYVNKLKKLKNVIFVGLLERNQIGQFLSDSICLLNTSYYEGFSNTFLESFDSGKPVITTKNIDPDGIIQEHKLGITVDNFEELSDAIIQLNSNDFKRDVFNNYLCNYHEPVSLCKQILKYL